MKDVLYILCSALCMITMISEACHHHHHAARVADI